MLTATKWSDSLVNSEGGIQVLPFNWQPNSRYAGVIYCHGHGGDELEPWHLGDTSEPMRNLITAIANAGFPVLSCYFGGNLWGNSAALTKLDGAVSYMQNVIGANPNKVALIGQSMGHCTAMNWARIHKDKVSCVVSSMGVTDLNDLSTQYTDVATAYPNGDWNTEAYSPLINAGTKFAGIPWQGWIGSSDTVAKTANMQQFGTLLGGEVNVVSGTHSWATVGNYDIAKIVSFLRRHALT